MAADDIIREFPKGLLYWYSFRKSDKVLHISNDPTSITELLKETCSEVICAGVMTINRPEFLHQYEGYFDYIIAIDVIEYLLQPEEALSLWKQFTIETGTLLLGTDNRLGLRYFCGDITPYTGRSFDGIENYRRIRQEERKYMHGRNYSKVEITDMLENSGWEHHKFYCVLPDLSAPQLIYAEDCLPKEELGIRFQPRYHCPDKVFLEEEFLYKDMIQNELFHAMANTFFVEVSCMPNENSVQHVTLSMDRGRDHAMMTIIRSDKTVEKKAVYPEGECQLQLLKSNEEELKSRGIEVVTGVLQKNSYITPYVDRPILMLSLQRMLVEDKEAFLRNMDDFRDTILQSSKHYKEDMNDGMGVILQKGFWDLVPLNCFDDNGRFLFFDQEFYQEQCPANLILYRAIVIIYTGNLAMDEILPIGDLFKRYALNIQLPLWQKMSYEMMVELRHMTELRKFNEKYRRDPMTIHTNRQRMNYSLVEYKKIFIDIFKGADCKKVILFGSGAFTKRFLAQFKKEYDIYAILDNNKEKWGSTIEGISVQSPDIVGKIKKEELHVIICVKSYTGIVFQLQKMGLTEYCIYDPNNEYPRKQRVMSNVIETPVADTRYHTGYIAGVFDLFHVGHLNMFKRAKEQCQYLIVGVVSDDGVAKYKKTKTYIPFKERIEIVGACKYVDEAVEIPLYFAGTKEAYNIYQFDCQFSGSDYEDDPNWLADREFLLNKGSDMVFFPYTKSTSSTELKDLIKQKLI